MFSETKVLWWESSKQLRFQRLFSLFETNNALHIKLFYFILFHDVTEWSRYVHVLFIASNQCWLGSRCRWQMPWERCQFIWLSTSCVNKPDCHQPSLLYREIQPKHGLKPCKYRRQMQLLPRTMHESIPAERKWLRSDQASARACPGVYISDFQPSF